MSKISFKQFRDKYNGVSVDVPWGYKGECVSLAQRYVNECGGYPLKTASGANVARGDGKDFGNSLVARGEGYIVTAPRYGDLVIYGSAVAGGYGHVGIYYDSTKMFDQNRGGDRTAALRGYISGHKPIQYVRLNAPLVPDAPKNRTEAEHVAAANAILNGKNVWGNGEARKANLKADGYNPELVQSITNNGGKMPAPKPAKPAGVTRTEAEHIATANAITGGKNVWGNGQARRDNLKADGYDPDKVQHYINYPSTPAPAPIKEGDRVVVRQGAKSYDGKAVTSAWYTTPKVVSNIKGDRAVLDAGSWNTPFRVSDLIKK